MQKAVCSFSADAENVRAARRFVSETCEQWALGEVAWPLVQIVSELASNAIIHAGTEFTVRLAHDGATTRIEVLDGSSRRAHLRGYDLDATTGRGLRLVEMLSREWGVSKDPHGKVVWAVVDAAGPVSAEPEHLAELFLLTDDDDPGTAPRTSRKARGRASRSSNRAA